MKTLLTKKEKANGKQALKLPAHPVQFRLPPQGEVDPWFGGNRSWWNERILPTPRNGWTPQIRSRVIRQPGAKKAIRFILWDSAEAYFAALDETTARELEAIRAAHHLPMEVAA
jgi:hypothetical protein